MQIANEGGLKMKLIGSFIYFVFEFISLPKIAVWIILLLKAFSLVVSYNPDSLNFIRDTFWILNVVVRPTQRCLENGRKREK